MSIRWEPTPRANKPSTLRPYTGEIEPLDTDDFRFFSTKYELLPLTVAHYIKGVDPSTQRYVLPIYSPEGHVRGHVLRSTWPAGPREPYWGKKADTYMAKHEPVQSFYFYRGGMVRSPIVAVEDQLSAIKLVAAGYDSVAMLGTPWSKDLAGYQGADRISEIVRIAGTNEVIVALDADATDAAFEFARKWGPAFKKLRVAILSKDLKDTPLDEFHEVLGV